MSRVWRLLPPRKTSGELSRMSTLAPARLAVIAAQSPALPPPITRTSKLRAESSIGLYPILRPPFHRPRRRRRLAVVRPGDRRVPCRRPSMKIPRQASLQNRFASSLSSVPHASHFIMAGLLAGRPGSLGRLREDATRAGGFVEALLRAHRGAAIRGDAHGAAVGQDPPR